MDDQAETSGLQKRPTYGKSVAEKRKIMSKEELYQHLTNDCSSDEDYLSEDTLGSSSDDEEETIEAILSEMQGRSQTSLQDNNLQETEKKWCIEGMIENIEFTKRQELLVPVPGEGKPIDFFNMLITNDFLQTIIDESNNYAVEVLVCPGTRVKSRITEWKTLSLDEFKVFLGLFLHTGTISLSRLSDYWKTDPLFNLPLFRRYMSKNRFLIILRCLHCTSPNRNTNDRLHKIRPVVDYFNKKMCEVYYPNRELSLDEAMVLWRGRLQFKQYIKNKRHKYGIKLYMLTEPTGLILKFRIYEGASDIYGGSGHTEKIVLFLLEEKLGNGHAVYLDNFYNSVQLARKLLDNKTYCTGTLRIDRQNNPKEVVTAKLKKGENKSMFKDGVHCGKWRDKRDVTYITTEFGNIMGEFKNKRGVVSNKPKSIIAYNTFMSGIDRQDQMLAYYPCNRKTIRWYKKIFFHILQMSLLNAHHLYNKYSGRERLSLYDFRLEIIKSLLDTCGSKEKSVSLQKIHKISKIEKTIQQMSGAKEFTRIARKECRFCRRNKRRKMTIFECKACPEYPGLCVECFDEFHKN